MSDSYEDLKLQYDKLLKALKDLCAAINAEQCCREWEYVTNIKRLEKCLDTAEEIVRLAETNKN